MGEVWRARDTKLGREVAIKTLPAEFAQDSDRLARFEREAKLLASLNHPNIAGIYGFEHDAGTHFLVLELVEGDTLADRLQRGAIPVEESLKLALQIAEALEAAHEKGVIHRDLKPANIKVTPDGKVKVLDFGLAKAFAVDQQEASPANSPTLSMQATQQGMILGTAAYMSPEQAMGRTVDKRTDVWAFGCVLHEMLTGRQVFTADDVSLILARVLEREPDFTLLPPRLHPRVRELLEQCLEKEAQRRWQAIGDVRVQLQRILADGGGIGGLILDETARDAPRAKVPWVWALVFGAVVAGVAVWILKPDPPVERAVIRFPFVIPDGNRLNFRIGRSVAISPDGTQIAFSSSDQLHLRRMDEMVSVPIDGTRGRPTAPVFSPDGRSLAYVDGLSGILHRIGVEGGTPISITQGSSVFAQTSNSLTWQEEDTIMFTIQGRIMSVSAVGGDPEVLVEAYDEASSNLTVQDPQILPGGEWVLFSLANAQAALSGRVVVASISSGEQRTLFEGGTNARYVPTGHIVYALADDLMARRFDVNTLEVGDAIPVLEGIQRTSDNVNAHYYTSGEGTLVYALLRGSSLDRDLAFIGRDQVVERLGLPPGEYRHPRVSPDARRLAVERLDAGLSQIFVYDLSGETQIQPLTREGSNSYPVWTPDSQRLAFTSNRDGTTSLWWQRADGSELAEQLTFAEGGSAHQATSWSQDGQTLAFDKNTEGQVDVWTLSLESMETTAFDETPGSTQQAGAFSPNGEWIAYHSNENMVLSVIYVQPFPPTGAKYPMSSTGELKVEPSWSPDGRELFYEVPLEELRAVDVSTETGVTFGPERSILDGNYLNIQAKDYDIHPDGERFLVVVAADQADGGQAVRDQINIVVNWFEELKERVPAVP